jgi:hypothetical protein
VPNQDPTTAAAESISRLEALAEELTRAGWHTRLMTGPDRFPRLHVQNPLPGATALSEDIYCAPRDGIWTFRWSWGEAISADVAEAVRLIGKVLRAAGPADALSS